MKLLFIFGTRPEAIKMAPLILKAKEDASYSVGVCVTGQHNEMLHQVLDFFGIRPDYDLNVMRPDQSLYEITADILMALEGVIKKETPSAVLVQGDTTTAFVGALASFYQKIPVAHVEAGLRSHNKYSPFPEEINRAMVGHIADFHFAPTPKAKEALLREGKSPGTIHVVGNTVIDALVMSLERVRERDGELRSAFPNLDLTGRIILVTGHRRESFGGPFRDICRALKDIADAHDVQIVYPVHLNPNVRKPVYDILKGRGNIRLMEPLPYPHLVWLMSKSYMILTDSGGIQEEAPSLGKPVLVMREVTERTEGIEAGTCKLVGTKYDDIVRETSILLEDRREYDAMSRAMNPYGDGKSSERILSILKKEMLR